MSTWSDLRGVLAELPADPRRRPLGSPSLNSNDHQGPFRLHLQAWAEDIASDRHDRFGQEVEITVGGLDYPERHRRPRWGLEPPSPPEYPRLPAEQLTVSLDRPVVVASGHNTRSSVRVHNHQDRAEEVATNGQVTGRVVDPRSGLVVGGFARAQTMPRITFRIAAHQSGTIPLLIGPASSVGDPGYAIPPGEWAFDTVLTLDRGMYRTPPLPLTITS